MKNKSINFIKFAFLFVTSILMFNSCSKEESIPNGYNSSGVKVVDDIVYFKNADAFRTTLTDLHKQGRENLTLWEEENSFSNSYRKVLDYELSDSSDVFIENPIIEDPFFATVVNKDGIFIIEDTIHKITIDKEYLIPELNFSKLAEIEEGKNLKSSSNIMSHQIERKVYSSNGLKSVTWWNTRKKNTTSNPPVCKSNISAHLKCWCVNYIAYGSIGIRISGRKYKNGKWRDDEMWYGKVDGCALGGPTWSPPVQYCDSQSGTNKKNVDKTLLWYTGAVYCDEITCTYTYDDDGCSRISWTETWN